MKSDRQDEIARLVAEILEKPVDMVTPNARFVEDLGADSMNALELLAALERHYSIVIDPSRLVQMDTLAAVTAVIDDLVR